MDPLRSLRIEVPGRLVGEQEPRPEAERAGERDPLLLAPGQLSRAVLHPVREPHLGEHLRRAAAEMLELVGLAERMEHRPGELSGGEQQRVALARALSLSPRLLLADEPTGNLDPQTAAGIHELLVDLNRSLGITAVVVTHNERLADALPRRLRLVSGRLA